MKSYKCPNCGKKQTTVREWQTCSVGYLRRVGTHDYIQEAPYIEGGDFENDACPDCGHEIKLPNE